MSFHIILREDANLNQAINGTSRRVVQIFFETICLILPFVLLSSSCSAQAEGPTAVPTLHTPSDPAPTLTLTPLRPTNTPIPTTSVLPTATPTQTPTPIPESVMAIPNDVAPLIEFEVPGWTAVFHAQPEAAFNAGEVDAALVVNGEGQLLWQSPIVLAVPWTMDWESVTLEEAEQIVQAGHPQVDILFWSDLSPHLRPLRVNGRLPHDPAYPLFQTLSLRVQNNINPDPLLVAAQNLLPRDEVIHLTAVGDMMLSRQLGREIQQGNVNFPFVHMARHLQQADITIGNVESALGSGGSPAAKSYTFQAPPGAAESLANAGFDVVSLANNHGMDFGPEGLLEAIDLLNAFGVIPIGAGINKSTAHAAHITQINGIRLAILAYVHVPVEYFGFDTQSWAATETTPGLAWGDPEEIKADITAVSDQVDLVIVVLHSGYEYVAAPSPPQLAAAQAAVEAGAHLVVGHHAHVLQGVQFNQKSVIVYGLGNFAFNIDGPPETAVLDVWLDRDGVRQVMLTPVINQATGQPRFATPAESTAIRQQLYQLTNLLND